MCLSVPAKILEIIDDPSRLRARVEHEGNVLVVDISLIDVPVVGDYVLLHAGMAIARYDPDAALETLKLHDELARIREKESGKER